MEKNKNQKQESKTKVEATYVIVILYLQLVVFSRQKQTSEKNFWIKTNVTSIPMKFEALLGLLASLYKSRVWRYIWNDTSRRIRKNKTLDLKKSFEYEHQCFSALLKYPFATFSWGNQHIREPIKLETFQFFRWRNLTKQMVLNYIFYDG